MIEYRDTVDGLTPQMMTGFFRGWRKPRSSEDHLRILQNSDHILLALDTETGRVVGFITALTDGVQSAFIPLLEVLPAYQRQGIGSTLLTGMLETLKGIPAIDLTCDPRMRKFYSKYGMIPSTGMIVRD